MNRIVQARSSFVGRLAAVLAAWAFIPIAYGAVGVNKSFTPNSVIAGQVSVLTIVLINPNSAAATGVSLTDTLPANVVVANPLTVGSNTCGFVVTATPGLRPIALSGGTIPPISGGVPGQCQLTINVVSTVPSTYLNTIAANAVSSSQGTNPQDAQATLVVSTPANVTGSKAFVPALVHGNGAASTLTITLNNPNVIPLTAAAFTDTLPATLQIASPSNAATSCVLGTATATPSNPATIALAGGTIPAGGSCTVTVDVVARSPNAFVNGGSTNTIGAAALTTAQGVTNPQIQANITVQTGAQIAKSFAPTPIQVGGTSTMTITINNWNASILTPITFTDTWAAAGMSVNGVPTTTCSGVLSNTANSVTLTGASLGPAPLGAGSTSCTITVPVIATATTANTIAAGNFGGVNYPAVTGTLTVSTITGSKAFTAPAVQTGSTTMTLTLNNLSSTAATITTITDQLTTIGAGFTVAVSATAGGTCGTTLASVVGGTLLTFTGGSIPANGSCTITLPVNISATAASGTNTIAVNGVQTSQGNNRTTITGAIAITRALTVAKAFNPGTVQAGTKSRLTVTLTRAGGALALNNITFTDLLTTMGAGFVVASPSNAATTCTGATLTAIAGATSFGITGGGLAGGLANTVCTVALDVATPAGPLGTHTNNIPANAVTTTEGVTNANTNANLVLASTSVTVNKSFSPTTVAVGGTSVMSIQIRNNNAGAIALTGVGSTDNLPAGMVVANPPVPTFSGGGCSGATITAVNNSNVVTLSGANVNAGSICTLAVTVRANVAGNLINTVPAAAVTSAQGVSNPLQGTATLAATGTVNLNITKTDGVLTVTPGGTTTYTINISNSGPNDITGLLVNDTPPAGVTFTAWTCVAGAGATCAASGSGPIADTVTIPNGRAVTYTVTAAIASNAVGSLTNTATLGVPGAVINTGNSSASDTDTLVPVTSIAITKSDGSLTYTPGLGATYTVTVTNGGPSDATNMTVSDTFPVPVVQSANVSCVAAGGAACGSISNLGTGFSVASASIPVGGAGTLVYSVPVSFPAAMNAASITNSVTATNLASSGPGSTATATDTDTLAAVADLAISKTDGKATYTPGTAITYTIIASNSGPSSVTGATVVDAVPAVITGATWTCVATVGSSCPASGAGNISAAVNLQSGGSATFTLTGTISASATGNLVNTATITPPAGVTDPNPGNNSATDTDTSAPIADLAVTKTDGVTSVTAGGTTIYTVIVTNNGPSAVTAATVSDLLPAGVTSFTWVCAASAGSSCPASGAGAIAASVNLLNGGTATFTVTAAISAATTGSIVNTATATVPLGTTDPTPGNNSATDTDTVASVADLTITKSDGATTAIPGTPITYTIVVGNSGPSDVVGATVADTLPAVLTGATWTCAASAGSSCPASGVGNINALVNLQNGGTATFVLSATISGAATGTLSNTATVTPPVGTTDPNPGNNSATDTDTLVPTADLAISKTDGATTAVPGSPITYTIVASNNGPSAVTAATVTDTLTATLTGATWTCVASAGSSCPASGAGNISASVNLLNGGTATFTLTATISAAATGTLGNTVTIIAPAGVTDPNPGNNSATDTDTLVPTADLAITKTDGQTNVVPGTAVTYTMVATNNGPSAVTGATVADTLPATITAATWTCVASVGSSCPASGSGNINALVNLLNGGTATFTLTGTVSASATGTLVNTATVTVPVGVTDPTPGNNSATDTDTLIPTADLVITKTDGVTSVNAGGTTTYTIVVTNNGPSVVTGATVNDTAPASLTFGAWTCTASAGSSCPASGSGNIAVAVNLINGGAATFTVNAAVAGNATGSFANTATVTPPAGVTDPTLGNNSATDTDTVNLVADLAITKTDGATTVVPGSPITYTIVATNNGPSAVTAATVTDTLPAAVLGATWTCVASAGSSCPASGSGSINASVNLLNGGTATFTLAATISASATGVLVNTATITPPSGVTDPNPGNNTATDTDTLTPQITLTAVKTDGSSSYTPGGTATYTITFRNTGVSDALDVTVADALPAGVTLTANATCAAAGSAACGTVTGTTGQSALGTTGATLPAGGANTLTFTVPVAFVSSLTTDPLVNSATVTDVGSGATATGTDSDVRAAQIALVLAKTDGSASYTPGGTATYVVTLTNTGPSDALDVALTDLLPTGLTLTANVSCVANGSALCGAVVGSNGQISFSTTGAKVGAGAGDSLVFNAPVSFAPGMVTNPLVNTANATDNATGATATASDSDTLAANVSLAVVKTDGSATYTPGGTATYTVTITNGGLSNATNVTVGDSMPAGVTLTANVICTAIGVANCGTVSGSTGQTSFGALGAQIGGGSGNSLVFTVPVAFAASLLTDPLVNTVTATDQLSGATGSGVDSDVRAAQVTLAVVKTDGSPTYTPGGTGTYTVTVTNTGATNAANVTINDPLPLGVTLANTAVCAGVGTASCGTVTGTAGQSAFGATGATIAAGAGNSLVFTAPVNFAASLTDDPLINSATALDVPSGASGSGSDSDARLAQAALAVTKSDGSATYTPGGTATYIVAVTNAGPSDVANTTVSDPLPPGVTLTANATCVAAGSAACGTVTGTTGQSSFGATGASVGAGAGNALTFTVPVAFAPSLTTDPLNNTVTVTDPASAMATATDSDTRAGQVTLAVSKSDGSTTYTPGGTATYVVTIANTGISEATNVTVTDPLPAGVTLSANASCVATGSASCGTVTGTSGQTSFGATGARVGAGAGNALTFTAPVAFASTLTTNPLVNTATATDVSTGATGSGSDSDTLGANVGLAVVKTDGSPTYTPGGTATYTVTVTSTGVSDATNVSVGDALPTGVTLTGNVSCAPVGSALCGTVTGTSGQTSFGAIGARIGAGAGNSLVFTVPVQFAAGLTTNPLVNTATATDIPTGASASGSDSDARATLLADLVLIKTGPATVNLGSTIAYTLQISNGGPAPAGGSTFSDLVPNQITGITASCGGATGGAVCGAVVVSGNSVSGTIPTLPVNGRLVITIVGTVTGNGGFSNTALVTPPAGTTDPNPGNNQGTAVTNQLAGPAKPIPAFSPWAMVLLLLLLGFTGVRRIGRRTSR